MQDNPFLLVAVCDFNEKWRTGVQMTKAVLKTTKLNI